MLGNPVEFAAIVEDVVLLRTSNVLILLKEWNGIEKLVSIVISVLGKENLL